MVYVCEQKHGLVGNVLVARLHDCLAPGVPGVLAWCSQEAERSMQWGSSVCVSQGGKQWVDALFCAFLCQPLLLSLSGIQEQQQ